MLWVNNHLTCLNVTSGLAVYYGQLVPTISWNLLKAQFYKVPDNTIWS